MTAPEILAELRRRRVEVVADDAGLRWRPRQGVDDALLTAMRQHKAELLKLLTAPEPDTSQTPWSPWPASLAGLSRQIDALTTCAVPGCGAGTWAYYGNIPFCPRCTWSRGELILAYRAALHVVWTLVSVGVQVEPTERARALDELLRRADDTGEPTATVLRHRWEREWWADHGRCPRCGEVEYHGVHDGASAP